MPHLFDGRADQLAPYDHPHLDHRPDACSGSERKLDSRQEEEKDMPRIVRVATTAFGYCNDESESRKLALELVDAAGKAACDIVVLPENFYRDQNGQILEPSKVRSIQEQLQGLAQRYAMYVVAGLPHWEDGLLFNCAILYDRAGQVGGIYRKIHPTEGEIESGIAPGWELPVFNLDFGKIGMLICFDIGWPLEWRHLAEKGAELVFWLSAYDGGFPLQAYAWEHKYYVVSSVRSTEAKFIDITGAILGGTSRWTRLAIAELNLDKKLFHIDQNWEKLLAAQAHYGRSIQIRGFSEENFFTLEALDDSVTVEQIVREFGLEPYQEYHCRVTQIQDKVRKKNTCVFEEHSN